MGKHHLSRYDDEGRCDMEIDGGISDSMKQRGHQMACFGAGASEARVLPVVMYLPGKLWVSEHKNPHRQRRDTG